MRAFGGRRGGFRKQVRISDEQAWHNDPGQPVVYEAINGVWYRTYWPRGSPMPDNVKPRADYDRLDRKWEELPWLPKH